MISLVDEISFTFPPSPPISQYDDIPPEQFCNGDNRPADCGENCECTHKIDIPLNAIVEVVVVDEGNYQLYKKSCADFIKNILPISLKIFCRFHWKSFADFIDNHLPILLKIFCWFYWKSFTDFIKNLLPILFLTSCRFYKKDCCRFSSKLLTEIINDSTCQNCRFSFIKLYRFSS